MNHTFGFMHLFFSSRLYLKQRLPPFWRKMVIFMQWHNGQCSSKHWLPNTWQNKTYPPLSLTGYGRVLPPQNSVGSPGHSPGLWDIVCCANSSVATLLRHLLHRDIWSCHHHRHRGLLYRAVCLGTLHLWETQGRLACVIVCCPLEECSCFFSVWVFIEWVYL